MKRKNIERYKDRYISVGVPHFYQDNALFFYAGTLFEMNDDGVYLRRGNDEFFITYDRIKQIRASGNAGVYESEK